MAESHQYTIYASNLKEAFIKILEIVGTPWRTDKRAGKSRTYKRLPHREGYPKDMFHYKIAWEPHLVLIRREISDLKWRKETTL